MTNDITQLMRESAMTMHLGMPRSKVLEQLTRFAEVAQAAQRNAMYAERSTLLFNPYTGKPRHPSDISSDPNGILMVEPEALLRARSKE